jgi:hypothetical protein
MASIKDARRLWNSGLVLGTLFNERRDTPPAETPTPQTPKTMTGTHRKENGRRA